MSRFKISRMSKTKQEIVIAIKQLLFHLPLSERIALIEKLGKQYRQQNSREISKEVEDFRHKAGVRKDIDYSAILRKEK